MPRLATQAQQEAARKNGAKSNGRPKIPDAKKKQVRVWLWASKKDKKAFKSAADRQDKKVWDWMRDELLDAASNGHK